MAHPTGLASLMLALCTCTVSASAPVPRQEHPRPDLFRENWMTLNGEWQYEIDKAADGEARGLANDKISEDWYNKRVLNQAVKRNLERFPTDFMFQIKPEEAEEVRRSRSQSVTLNPETATHSSQSVMISGKHRGHSYLPYNKYLTIDCPPYEKHMEQSSDAAADDGRFDSRAGRA